MKACPHSQMNVPWGTSCMALTPQPIFCVLKSCSRALKQKGHYLIKQLTEWQEHWDKKHCSDDIHNSFKSDKQLKELINFLEEEKAFSLTGHKTTTSLLAIGSTGRTASGLVSWLACSARQNQGQQENQTGTQEKKRKFSKESVTRASWSLQCLLLGEKKQEKNWQTTDTQESE